MYKKISSFYGGTAMTKKSENELEFVAFLVDFESSRHDHAQAERYVIEVFDRSCEEPPPILSVYLDPRFIGRNIGVFVVKTQ